VRYASHRPVGYPWDAIRWVDLWVAGLQQLRKSDVLWFKVKMRIEHIEKLMVISEKELLLREDEWAHDSPTTTALW
jgi:hypothetical protein